MPENLSKDQLVFCWELSCVWWLLGWCCLSDSDSKSVAVYPALHGSNLGDLKRIQEQWWSLLASEWKYEENEPFLCITFSLGKGSKAADKTNSEPTVNSDKLRLLWTEIIQTNLATWSPLATTHSCSNLSSFSKRLLVQKDWVIQREKLNFENPVCVIVHLHNETQNTEQC